VPTRKLLLFAAVLLFVAMATWTSTSAAPRARYDVLPARPLAGHVAKLSASRSFCDRRPCTYRWARIVNRAKRRDVLPLGHGKVLSYRFPHAGTNFIRLSVTNRRGESASTVRKVVVSAAAPSWDETDAGAPSLPPGVTLREPDGGKNYFAQFANRGPLGNRHYFPLWLWGQYDMTNANIATDKRRGFNGYYGLVHPPSSNLRGLVAAGMVATVDAEFWSSRYTSSPAVIGYRLGDEADMLMGPGSDAWDGVYNWDHCIPKNTQGGRCGYTVMRTVNRRAPTDGRARIMNYGKGVAFWATDAEAATFINGGGANETMGRPGGFQDFVSADVYWFTDPDTQDASQGQCFYKGCNVGGDLTFEQAHRAHNYALTVKRVRDLDARDGKRQPIFGQIEMGWWRNEAPSDGYAPIKPAEMRAALWHSIIAGARGVVYLPFSFAGAPCGTQHHIQRDTSGCYTQIQRMATNVNAQVKRLAPVLNSRFADGYVTTSRGIHAMAKAAPDGRYYVFAGNKDRRPKTATFTLAGGQGASATVMGENRSVPITGGRFRDNFADGNAIHIYRINAGPASRDRQGRTASVGRVRARALLRSSRTVVRSAVP
jgi:hypothetical protein